MADVLEAVDNEVRQEVRALKDKVEKLEAKVEDVVQKFEENVKSDVSGWISKIVDKLRHHGINVQ